MNKYRTFSTRLCVLYVDNGPAIHVIDIIIIIIIIIILHLGLFNYLDV